MVEASKAYAEAMSSTVNFLIAANGQMVKDLQEARKRTKQSTGSTMTDMKKEIDAKISTLEATMRTVYKIFVTVHKVVVHLYIFQQQCAQMAQTLKDIHTVIAHMQEWTMRYKGASLYLHKRMKL